MHNDTTPCMYVPWYVIDDRVALIFGEHAMGLFLGPFLWKQPGTRLGAKTRSLSLSYFIQVASRVSGCLLPGGVGGQNEA